MLSATKSRFAGKIIIYILMIFALFTSCKKVETKSEPKEQIIDISKTDSITVNDFGEHKSIHQQEWEEHRQELGVDTVKTK